MQSNLTHTTLGDVCIKITDGAHASPKSVPYGKPMASVKDLTRFGININSARHISLADYHALVKQGCRPSVGDVLIAKDGNTALDTVCSIKTNYEVVLLSSVAILKPDPSKIDSDFLKYYLSSQDVISYLKSTFISGAAIPRVILRAFKQAEIAIPNIAAQKDIASILNAIDDKILNLTNTNRTLEAIAQTIFKSWFVNFDPVHAKQQGIACSGIDAETAELFPDSFEDSELGLIPKGWHISTVGKIYKLTMGQSPAGVDLNTLGNGIEFYQGRTDFGFRYPIQRVFCVSPTRIAKEDDILISVRAPVGDVNVAMNECCIGRGVAAIRHPLSFQSFALYQVKQLKEMFKIYDGEGTVFGSISKTDFENIKLIAPSPKLAEIFQRLISPIDDRIKLNENQILDLSRIRDTLLPRLIGGKLDVSAIEAQLEETA